MSVARITEISATSPNSFEDAIRTGLDRATKTLRHIEGAWVKEQEVRMKNNQIVDFKVNMLVTFVLDDDD
jgi:dodecin